MNKASFLELGENVEGFEITNPERAPQGLTKEIIWDLWDIGVKFGQPIDKGIGFDQPPLIMNLYDFRGNEIGGRPGLTVGKKRESGLIDEGIHLFELKNGINVIWDMGFPVVDIQKTIKEIDELATSANVKVGDTRILLFDNEPPRAPKMRISRIFKNQETVIPVFPDQDINQALNDFDYPELLEVIDQGLFRLICLKSKKQQIIADSEKKMERLKKMGITPEKLQKMSIDELMALKRQLNLNMT